MNPDTNNAEPQFSYDAAGYLAAQNWLKEVGEWDRISTSGFSTDGLSIIHAANALWEQHGQK